MDSTCTVPGLFPSIAVNISECVDNGDETWGVIRCVEGNTIRKSTCSDNACSQCSLFETYNNGQCTAEPALGYIRAVFNCGSAASKALSVGGIVGICLAILVAIAGAVSGVFLVKSRQHAASASEKMDDMEVSAPEV
jgi:hypothetical protein